MRKTREILRQKWALQRSHRAVARNVGLSAGVVGSVVSRAKAARITSWAEVEVLDEAALDAALYRGPGSHGDGSIIHERAEPDCTWIHR